MRFVDALRRAAGWARLSVPVILGLAILLGGQAGAWAAAGQANAGQTIPTVTPVQATGTPVALPDGLERPAAPAAGPPWAAFSWEAFPFGCLCAILALVLLASAIVVSRRSQA
jgi:hypothetical protein